MANMISGTKRNRICVGVSPADPLRNLQKKVSVNGRRRLSQPGEESG